MSINLLLSVKILPGISGYKSNGNIKYPQGVDYVPLPTIEVFILAIKSYSKIQFNNAYILLDIEDLNSEEILRINNAINDNLNANFLSIKYERPSKKLEWIEFIHGISDFGAYLVCMNHDMIFSSSNNEFHSLVERLKYKLLNSDTLLTYCHIPEMVSWASNNLKGYKFEFSEGRWESSSSRFWIDGIYIMSKSTLLKIFDLIIGDGPSYLPRFDWPGVRFRECKFTTVVVPVNVFSHYDGSTHILCSRLKELFSIIFFDLKLCPTTQLFKEFIDIFYISFAFWFLMPRVHHRKNFSKYLRRCFNHFIDGKKLCNVTLSKSEYDHLLGLLIFYESIIYDNSMSDSKQIHFPLKSYLSFYLNEIKRLFNL